jgi:hypothetical protein
MHRSVLGFGLIRIDDHAQERVVIFWRISGLVIYWMKRLPIISPAAHFGVKRLENIIDLG